MRAAWKFVAMVVLMVAAAAICSGCPALMIPGLAYSGYKYEHDKNQPSATATTAQSKSSAPNSQKIPNSDIE
jgi:hypothetical protein